jgi:hypothetical protein
VKWHQMWSIRLALSGAALNAAAIGWTVFQGSISAVGFAAVNMALGIGVAIVRVLSQVPEPK